MARATPLLGHEGPLRGGTAVQALGLVNDADESRLLRFVTIGEVGPWIEVRQTQDGEPIEAFAIGAGGDATFDLAVSVPDDVANGTYEGALRVLSGSTEPGDAAVEIGVELPVTVIVNGTQVIAAAMEDFTVGTAEVGTPLPLSVAIHNDGTNVRHQKAILVIGQAKIHDDDAMMREIHWMIIDKYFFELETEAQQLFEVVAIVEAAVVAEKRHGGLGRGNVCGRCGGSGGGGGGGVRFGWRSNERR